MMPATTMHNHKKRTQATTYMIYQVLSCPEKQQPGNQQHRIAPSSVASHSTQINDPHKTTVYNYIESRNQEFFIIQIEKFKHPAAACIHQVGKSSPAAIKSST
jgi:hypothetical protein